MGKYHLIMPMGGAGSRFKTNGVATPKPLIDLNGKPFFVHAAESAIFNAIDITFVVLKEHVIDWKIDERIREYYPDAKIVVLSEQLNGAVMTAAYGVSYVEDSLPIVINDCDHSFDGRWIGKYFEDNEFDGALLTFKSSNPSYSYVTKDCNGRVIKVVEKEVISDDAVAGAYLFRDKDEFTFIYNKYVDGGECKYNEYFISGMYQVMIDSGKVVKAFSIDDHIDFGTPDAYNKLIGLKGNSGFSLRINSEKDTVVKSTKDNIERLKNQCQKQRDFISNSDDILAVPVISEKIDYENNEYSFEMKYIDKPTLAEAILQYDESVLRTASIVAKMIKDSFHDLDIDNTSPNTIPPYPVEAQLYYINEKIESLTKKGLPSWATDYLKLLKGYFEKNANALESGYCHGDLTLENMLYDGEKIYLIDFLDNFVQCPWCDAATILQDTVCGWSYRNKSISFIEYNNIKNWESIFMGALEVNTAERIIIYSFLLLKLIRIIPYTKDVDTLVWLKKQCKNVDDKINKLLMVN